MDESGAAAGPRQRGPLNLAAAAGGGVRTVVLATATQVLFTEPELPPGSGLKLARAVPFALEEQLTEDIDKLMFAIGRRGDAGRTPVAVVSRDIMQGWMSRLADAGITPAAMYPDMSLMPPNPGQTVLWLEGERLAVRRPGALPFAVELTPVTDALIIAGVVADRADPAADQAPKPLENAILYLTREDWTRVKADFDALADRFDALKVQLLAEGPLPWLARELAGTDAVNLLQGEFTPPPTTAAGGRSGGSPRCSPSVLLAAHVGAQTCKSTRPTTECGPRRRDRRRSSRRPCRPTKCVDPRRQMQERLDRIHRSDRAGSIS